MLYTHYQVVQQNFTWIIDEFEKFISIHTHGPKHYLTCASNITLSLNPNKIFYTINVHHKKSLHQPFLILNPNQRILNSLWWNTWHDIWGLIHNIVHHIPYVQFQFIMFQYIWDIYSKHKLICAYAPESIIPSKSLCIPCTFGMTTKSKPNRLSKVRHVKRPCWWNKL